MDSSFKSFAASFKTGFAVMSDLFAIGNVGRRERQIFFLRSVELFLCDSAVTRLIEGGAVTTWGSRGAWAALS